MSLARDVVKEHQGQEEPLRGGAQWVRGKGLRNFPSPTPALPLSHWVLPLAAD